ncbi:MAG: choice-of-anchor J domain-containing protein [Dysgonamonadaceae bacterium]|jgi:hypothetical protein|nr:choice-of-anchor J domain-containing protein [Dysgonamonadaceae bacterium]
MKRTITLLIVFLSFYSLNGQEQLSEKTQAKFKKEALSQANLKSNQSLSDPRRTSAIRTEGTTLDAAKITQSADDCNISSLPYEEGWEDGSTLPCWTNYSAAETERVWEVSSKFVHSGTNSIRQEWGSSGVHLDNWFVSPKISIPAEGFYRLSFWSYNEYPTYYPTGGNSVWISESGADPANGNFLEIWSPESVSDSWVETALSLENYAGKEIYIAFRYNATYTHGWYVDDIKINEVFATDAGVTAITSPVNGTFDTPATVSIKVKNFGATALTNVPVKAVINGGTAITGKVPSIPVGAEVDYTFPATVDLSTPATYTINAFTELPGDGNEANDSTTIEVISLACTVSEFPYEEGWEDDFILPCWNFYDRDGDGAGINWRTETINSHSGNRSIYHPFHYSHHQDGWLVSPKISIPGNGHYLLSFWSYNSFYTAYGRNTVLVSEGSSDPASDDFEPVWSPEEVTGDWVQTKIDLDEYAGKDIYIAFRYEGLDAHQWWLDDLKIEQISDFDAGVTAILSPRDGNRDATETVKIKVKNFGREPLTNVPVTLEIDGTVTLNSYVPSIARDEEVEYEFPQTVDLSTAKTYSLKAYTELSGDENTENDAATATVISVACPEPSLPYAEGAEDPLKLLCWTNYTAAETDKVWEVSSLQAHSGINSIFHDWSDFYQDVWLVSPQISIPADGIYRLSFWSYNGSASWYLADGNSVWISESGADPTSSTSGFVKIWSPESVSESWVETKLRLADYAGKKIYIAFRYKAVYAHTWYVDDIQIDQITGVDAGVTAITSPVTGANRSEETITVKVRNFGSQPLSNIPIKAKINETTVIDGDVPSLPVNSEIEYSFPTKADLSEVTSYNIKVYTLVEDDIDPSNDTATVTVINNGNVAVIGTDATVTACDIQFVDDGMSGNYFGPSTDGKETQTITFYPALQGNRLKVEFTTFFTMPYEEHEWFGEIYELPGDTLFVYSGATSDEDKLLAALSGDLTGSLPPAIRSRAADGSLTFVFDKHKATEASGWEARISCFEPQPQDVGVNKILAPLAGGNEAAQVKVLIENYGANSVSAFPVAYSLDEDTEIVENFTGTIAPMETVEFTFTQTVDLTEYKTFRIEAHTKLPGDGDASNDTASVSFKFIKNVTLYGYRLWDDAYENGTMTENELLANISFSSYNPQTVTTEHFYRDNGNVICAAEYADGFIYGYTGNENYVSVNFVKLRSDWTEVSKNPAPNMLINDMTYDYSTNTMYAVTIDPDTEISTLNTVNLETGALTPVASLPASAYLFTLAADLNGRLYGIEYSGYLVTVDKTTGTLTPVGDTKIQPDYLQSMTFDHNTGRLFWAMYDDDGLDYSGRLLELDSETGAVTDLGRIGKNAEIVGLYTLYSPGDGLPPVANQDLITVYPNPATNVVYISSIPDKSSLSIIDLSGKTLETYAPASGMVRLDLHLDSGVYLIQIKNGSQRIMKKLLVK